MSEISVFSVMAGWIAERDKRPTRISAGVGYHHSFIILFIYMIPNDFKITFFPYTFIIQAESMPLTRPSK